MQKGEVLIIFLVNSLLIFLLILILSASIHQNSTTMISTHLPLDLSNRIKLQLSSHRLSSRRCQVRFTAQDANRKMTRGHMLVDPSLSLREVSQIIRQRICQIQHHGLQHHSSFYCIPGRESSGGFIFFESYRLLISLAIKSRL